jgi:hypothetical protein
MPLSTREVKALLKQKGWKSVDLAAHWGHCVAYVSWLVNNPSARPPVYDDAFRGLLQRDDVVVQREERHRRKPPKAKWTAEAMYPKGRVFVAQDSSLGPEEGTELAVLAVARRGDKVLVQFEILTGDAAGDHIEVFHGAEADRLGDTGQDRAERQQYA